MKQLSEYLWDETTGEATCILHYKNLTFVGKAHCHPDDKDMQSKITGQTIAEWRAMRSYLRHLRDNELKPQLKSLKQLYYAMNRSQQFNEKSYEAKMLFGHIENLELDLEIVNQELALLVKNTKDYIDSKEKVFQSLRKMRQAKVD